MSRLRTIFTLTVALLLSALPAFGAKAQDATPAADHSDIEIAYVLHGLNTFTERMKTGAEDAGRDHGVYGRSLRRCLLRYRQHTRRSSKLLCSGVSMASPS